MREIGKVCEQLNLSPQPFFHSSPSAGTIIFIGAGGTIKDWIRHNGMETDIEQGHPHYRLWSDTHHDHIIVNVRNPISRATSAVAYEFAHPIQRSGFIVALDRNTPFIQSTNPRTAPNRRIPLSRVGRRSSDQSSSAPRQATQAGYRPQNIRWPPPIRPPLDCKFKHILLCEYVSAALEFGNRPDAVGDALSGCKPPHPSTQFMWRVPQFDMY